MNPAPIVPLSELLRSIPGWSAQGVADQLVTGIALDSRQVLPGNLFVALPGGVTDGHRYIPEAIRRGAAAVVGTQPLESFSVPYIRVGDGRGALAALSAAYYGFPAHRLTIIGVTGTDGKTTTCNLIYHILRAAGLPAGMISTINAVIGEQALDTGFHVTTPEAPDVQRYLAQMVAAGLTHVVLEATSHGLEQQRVGACEFDVAVATNITHEHLDYHGDFLAYRAAKARLFTELGLTPAKPQGNPRLAVLNRDEASFEYLAALIGDSPTAINRTSYGLHPSAHLRAEEVRYDPGGLRFTAISAAIHPPLRLPVQSNLLGDFNLPNCLAAIAAMSVGLGIAPQAIQAGIASLHSLPGRMEVIDQGQEFLAIVDFAHTPNALRHALETCRRLVPGRVIAVFGSAGLRDRAKRRMMAEVSAQLADLTVLTAEDPRSESLEEILAEIATGMTARGALEGQTFWRVHDRGEAVRFAVSLARAGDLVIVCGKGHEQSMCFGQQEYPWDDRVALRAALAERLGLPGPTMPCLPTQGDCGMIRA